MNTVSEIQTGLPQLSTLELLPVDQSLHDIYRYRKDGMAYNAPYGMVTEADLIASAEAAFLP